MNPKSIIIVCASTLVLAACALQRPSRYDATTLRLSADDQCRILYHKRVKTPALFRAPTIARRARTAVQAPAAKYNKISSASIDTAVPAYESALLHSPALDEASPIQAIPSSSSGDFVQSLKPRQAKREIIHTSSPHALPTVTQSTNWEASYEWKKDVSAAGVLGLGGLMGVGLIFWQRRRARRFSHWAKQNPWKARGIIAAIHAAVGVPVFLVGSALAQEGVMITDGASYAALAFTGMSVLLYPIGVSGTNYLSRKFHDAILFTSGSVLVLSLGNHYALTPSDYSVDNRAALALASIVDGNAASELAWHKPSTIEQGEPKKKSKIARIALIFLASILYAGALVGLAMISCSIACSGGETLAVCILLSGTALATVFFVAVLRQIMGKQRRKANFEVSQ